MLNHFTQTNSINQKKGKFAAKGYKLSKGKNIERKDNPQTKIHCYEPSIVRK